MDLGILVYVDNKPELLEDFSWLYKSCLWSDLFSVGTVIAVCHPQMVDALPRDERLIVIPQMPCEQTLSRWQGYGFINSIGNLCSPEVKERCRDFKYLLKTDCDTFVTPALRDFRPAAVCCGIGAYAYEESVRRKLAECSARWGFPHTGQHNVGASILGPVESVLCYIDVHFQCCDRLLEEEFQSYLGEWPGWCKNVLTLYGGELALRLTYPERFSIGLLDHVPSDDRRLGSDVLHIHAWHRAEFWSKHAYRAGKYAHLDPSQLDLEILGNYCHWLAASSIEQIREAAARRGAGADPPHRRRAGI